MPLDPQIARILDEIAAREPNLDPSIEARRADANDIWTTVMGRDVVNGVSAVDGTIPGPAGDITVRIYRPDSLAPGEAVPTIVYFHGGSWIIGDIASHDSATRRLAREIHAVVVSVEYRLAPEHPFPAGFDDSKAAMVWAIANAHNLGGDPDTVIISGDSAGGNFCAALGVVARDEDLPLAGALMFYPSSDLSRRYPAMDTLGSGYLLETPPVEFADPEYLVDPALRFDPRVSPILSESFAGVAPAVIYTAEFDPIKEHGEILVEAYRAAGVTVIHRESPGMIHGYLQAGNSPAAVAEIDRASHDLRRLLGIS